MQIISIHKQPLRDIFYFVLCILPPSMLEKGFALGKKQHEFPSLCRVFRGKNRNRASRASFPIVATFKRRGKCFGK